MQREILGKLTDVDGDGHYDGDKAARFSEQRVMIDDLELLFLLDKPSRKRLNLINNALNRLRRNEYDHCIRCGKTIAERRLELDPLTEYCSRCASSHS